MTDDLTFDRLRDVFAAVTAETDQLEAKMAEILGIERIAWNAVFVVSPDVGMRLTRNGVIPVGVRINWNLPSGSIYAVNPEPRSHGRERTG